MDNQIKMGKMNTLEIDRVTDFGLFLVSGDGEDVLLPNIYVKPEMEVGKFIQVFIYADSEDRIVATTLKPAGEVGDFVALEIVDVNKVGAFLDWGLAKDLLVPKPLQKTDFNIGEKKVVKIIEDVKSDRLLGTEKFSDFLSTEVEDLKRNQKVNLMVFKETPMGYKVLISEIGDEFKFEGLLFKNEVFQHLEIGLKLNGYIKKIRDDGKIDVSLQPIGNRRGERETTKVVEKLKEHNGKLPFTYKSDATEISETFELSKKAFKRALTELIEKKRLKLNENSIELI